MTKTKSEDNIEIELTPKYKVEVEDVDDDNYHEEFLFNTFIYNIFYYS